MSRKRLLWQLYPSYFLITILAVAAAAWYASVAFRGMYIERTARGLEEKARLLEDQIKPNLLQSDTKEIDALCKRLGSNARTRITVIIPSGRVVGDTEEDPLVMDNHADRPEVIEAMAGGRGQSIRFSHTLAKDMMYVAIPLKDRDEIIGVVRTSVPLTSIGKVLSGMYVKILIGAVIIAVIAGIISLAVSRRISRPLEDMKRVAGYFARGHLKHRLPVPDTDELGSLAEAMNEMASQLDERIQTITRQRDEQEAILTSMIEGVVAVDEEERIISINQAGARMLEVDRDEAKGRSIQEAIRNTAFQNFVSRTLSEKEPVEGEIYPRSEGERYLQTHGTIFSDAQGEARGAVVVLNDVTRIKQLENLRREFVANVSHELKTPITSIKGFVETMQEGAINVREDEERFLGIISNQVDRLNAIIEDLLLLSKIEQYEEKKEIEMEQARLKHVLESAIQICEVKAAKKNINIDLACEDELTARINPPLLEQAVVNLIDNAIKASEPGGAVKIEAFKKEEGITIEVHDQGCGIAKEHIPRLFERFYRVDKARSRKLGGTGIGLAIVKHIAQAHKGTVSVESDPGKGSRFTIRLSSN
jgi:two-component system phosphate regulon sensor histidine kinase PhoR